MNQSTNPSANPFKMPQPRVLRPNAPITHPTPTAPTINHQVVSVSKTNGAMPLPQIMAPIPMQKPANIVHPIIKRPLPTAVVPKKILPPNLVVHASAKPPVSVQPKQVTTTVTIEEEPMPDLVNGHANGYESKATHWQPSNGHQTQTPSPTPAWQQPIAQPATQPMGQSSTIGQSQSQIIAQILSDQLRAQFKILESKIDAKLEMCVRDVVGSTIRDLKTQFETSQILGETLNDKIPVFARPDPTATIEHVIEKRGTKLKLFLPMTSNVHGYWAQTPFVTNNGSVATGFVPIFTSKIDSIVYDLPPSELKSRFDQMRSHLDILSDKDFIPNIGKFQDV